MARKILLADDSVTAQNMGRKILADAGYEVITVNNGSAALKRVTESRPDVIVLDVYMPGYSGLEVCQRLKETSDTARIPILLTVGKLEPFKPEEAKRARADAFIVKPFEASELLSALTKLEDKIVPRPEPSKPGRFARAIAAVEEGRYDKNVAIEADVGWKDRISFPSKKKKSKAAEPEEEGVDPAIYGPVGKDLRKVTQHTPEPRPEATKEDDPRVDLAALAAQGLPKDVTPEEIAALAAAAAHLKGTGRAHEETSGPVAENKRTEETSNDQFAETMAQPVAAHLEAKAPEVRTEDKPEAKAQPVAVEAPKEVAAPLPVVEAVAEKKAENKDKGEARADQREAENEAPGLVSPILADFAPAIGPPEPVPFTAAAQGSRNGWGGNVPADEPVTMAAAAGADSTSRSRWMAVPVALLPEEAALSLDTEMQKHHAALAAAEMASSAQVAKVEPEPPVVASAPAETPVAESPVPAPPAAIVPEAKPEETETKTAVASDAAEAIQAVVKEFETVAAALAEAHPPAPVVAEPVSVPTPEPVAQVAPETPQAVAAKAEENSVAEPGAPQPELTKSEAAAESAPAEQGEAKQKAEVEQKAGAPPKVDAVAAAPAEPTPSTSASESETAAPVRVPEVSAEPISAAPGSWHISEASAPAETAAGGSEDMAKKEKEMAATTAAAWATWRRVRESDPKAKPTAQEQDEAAMAVAAGAEKVPEEISPEGEPSEIANIVDSVLADLRPKIVEEISKKMGKKKK